MTAHRQAIDGGAGAVVSFNVTHMRSGATWFGIAVERPGVVIRRLAR